MTQEEKELLIKDLSARLSYGVKVLVDIEKEPEVLYSIDTFKPRVSFSTTSYYCVYIENIKPYLRPMDSMTEDEKKEYKKLLTIYNCSGQTTYWDNYKSIDWLNKHHFDFRHLIPMGLALEAKEGMYNIE